MMLRTKRCFDRSGVAALEFAVVAPILIMLLFGIFVGGLVISRYQQVAMLSRDCARYAQVHGGTWAQANNNGVLTTQEDVFTNVVKGRAFFFDLTTLQSTSSVTWDDDAQMPTTSSGMTNRVHVTIKYSLGSDSIPFVGSIFQGVTLQSTCERIISN
jgi:Flp pilus assembly protein TadG